MAERNAPPPHPDFLRSVLWVTNDFRGRTYLSLLSPRRHWCYISGKAADVSGQLDLLWRKALVAVGNPSGAFRQTGRVKRVYIWVDPLSPGFSHILEAK